MRQVFAERADLKPNATDDAIERETVITWSDADQMIHIATSQRTAITALTNNPSAILIEAPGKGDKEDRLHVFELPIGFVTFRKAKRTGQKTMPSGVALCGEPTKSGDPCKRIASKATGKCPRHST